jgi:hypothetical protein
MPPLNSSIEYLQKLPLYETEKPYWCLLTPRAGFDPDKDRLDNLEFEVIDDITFTDIRDVSPKPTINQFGFEVIAQASKILSFESTDDVDAYKRETEKCLESTMDAVFVKTYELRTRKNIAISRPIMNIADPLLYEGPARGAHNGILPQILEKDEVRIDKVKMFAKLL